jgi:hypothetical protein
LLLFCVYHSNNEPISWRGLLMNLLQPFCYHASTIELWYTFIELILM